jgi:hypothetical protein
MNMNWDEPLGRIQLSVAEICMSVDEFMRRCEFALKNPVIDGICFQCKELMLEWYDHGQAYYYCMTCKHREAMLKGIVPREEGGQ